MALLGFFQLQIFPATLCRDWEWNPQRSCTSSRDFLRTDWATWPRPNWFTYKETEWQNFINWSVDRFWLVIVSFFPLGEINLTLSNIRNKLSFFSSSSKKGFFSISTTKQFLRQHLRENPIQRKLLSKMLKESWSSGWSGFFWTGEVLSSNPSTPQMFSLSD